MFATLFFCLVPALTQDDGTLEPRWVSLHAEPGTARTESLLALLRTRFEDVSLNAYGSYLHVVDGAAREQSRIGDFQYWRPYATAGSRSVYGPQVFIGSAIPSAIEVHGFVGREAAVARAETVESLAHPAAPRASAELPAGALLGAHTPLAFALDHAPDVEIAWRAEDDQGRPVAVVWQQHRFLFFAPTADPDALGEDGRAALLDVVTFAGRFTSADAPALSVGAPGEGSAGELSWWLAREDVDLERCRRLLAAELAGVARDGASLRSWHADHGFALLADDDGRLAVDPNVLVFGRAPSDHAFIARAVQLLKAQALAERDLARRLLARHVANGPGAYASAAEWRAWADEAAGYFVHCPADARWRIDFKAAARKVGPETWPPRQRATGHLALDEAPAGATPAELVAWLLSVGPARGRYVTSMEPALARIVAGPLVDALERSVDADEQRALRDWIGKLGPAAALVAERMHARLERDPANAVIELRALADARPADATRLVHAVVRVAHARQSGDDATNRWPGSRTFENIAPQVARAIAASAEPGAAAELAVDLAVEALGDGHALVAEALTAVLAVCDAVRPDDLERLLAAASTRAALAAEAVMTRTLVKLVQASGDPRWISTLDALLERPRRFERSIVRDVAPAYLGLGAKGIARFERVLEGAVGMEHDFLVHVLARSTDIDDSWLETCLQDEGRRALAYAVLAHSPQRWGRWSERLRAAALGADEAEAILAVASLGNLAEHRREAVQPLAEALAHASTWVRRGAAFELGSPYRDVRAAEAALILALDDDDAWVGLLAAWALREPAGVGDGDAAPALRAMARGDGTLARVARDALQRRDPDPAWLLRELRGVRAVQADDGPISLDRAKPKARWEAARKLALSGHGSALLEQLADDDAATRESAEELIRRVDHELRAWLDERCEVLDGEMVSGPATDELSNLGPVAIAHLEHELMRPYRFPIGSASYAELVTCLGRIGGAAWPVLAASHWHWRGHGYTDTAPAWKSVGRDAADVLAPLSAMRLARDSALRCSFKWFADSRDAEVVERYLGPMWEALGEEGLAALDELSRHPLADVADAAERVRP